MSKDNQALLLGCLGILLSLPGFLVVVAGAECGLALPVTTFVAGLIARSWLAKMLAALWSRLGRR
jgi:hypothetical protein